ncbi:hypothetical protein [Herpetosiphon gulosus]
MTLLDRLIAQKEAAGDMVSAAVLAEIAPVAWHILISMAAGTGTGAAST